MKGINVIIVTVNGVQETPFVTNSNTKAQAAFDAIAERFMGEDVDEINLHSDTQLEELNRVLKHIGVEVNWFTDLEINK